MTALLSGVSGLLQMHRLTIAVNYLYEATNVRDERRPRGIQTVSECGENDSLGSQEFSTAGPIQEAETQEAREISHRFPRPCRAFSLSVN